MRHTNADQPSTRDNDQMPEVSLWTAVITQAVNDLINNWERSHSKALYGDTLYDLIDACNWIFSPMHERNFAQVCQYAQVDHEWVRRLVTKRMQKIEAGWTPDRLRRFTKAGGYIVIDQKEQTA